MEERLTLVAFQGNNVAAMPSFGVPSIQSDKPARLIIRLLFGLVSDSDSVF